MSSQGHLKFKIFLTSLSKEVVTELDFSHGFRAPALYGKGLIFVTILMLVNQLFRDRHEVFITW